MKLTPKGLALGSLYSGLGAALMYAGPHIATTLAGWWVPMVIGAIPPVLALITDARKKVEESE